MDAGKHTGDTPSEGSKGLAESVLDNLREGCQVVDPTFRYLYLNPAAAAQGRRAPAELLGRTMMECYPGIDQTEMFSKLRACMRIRKSDSMENEFTFPDGSKGWFELRFEPVPEGVAILSVDVTERVRAQAVLRNTSRALEVLSRANQALSRTEDEHSFLEEVCRVLVTVGGNRAAEIALDRSQHSEAVTIAAGECEAADREKDVVTLQIPAKMGSFGTLSISTQRTEPISSEEYAIMEEIARDLGFGIETIRSRESYRHAEQQLAASRRLEAVGRMAGGIAHDFNNVMSVIVSYLWIVEQQIPADSPLRNELKEMHDATERATNLTRQLLAFSRSQPSEPRATDVNQVIRNLENMLLRLLGESIQLDLSLRGELPSVLIDPSQLEQIVMNLAVNARDALPRGGTMSITTSEVTAKNRGNLKDGRYVVLTASDNGTGMAEDIKDRIFEPFFTTKAPGCGTGLGLSTVYGIVKQSGGMILVRSECGLGTTFELFFPSLPQSNVSAIKKSD